MTVLRDGKEVELKLERETRRAGRLQLRRKHRAPRHAKMNRRIVRPRVLRPRRMHHSIEARPCATILMVGLFSGLLLASAPTDRGADRPNVILIIADDMGRDDCGAYGNPKVKTPNIDRLAREGMRFDRAFVTASSCSPSRSSIITGRYPHNTDAEELHWPLPAEQVTFVEKLKAAGYWTAAAGKWHLGNAVKDRFDVVREADPSGFQLAPGTDAKARMTARGLGRGPERLRPVGARPA